MHREYTPSGMFAPETLLKKKKLQPQRMSQAELLQAIEEIADNAMPYCHFEYYLQLLGAVKILAGAALTARE